MRAKLDVMQKLGLRGEAMARRDLKMIEQEFFLAHPTSTGNGRGDNQAFFPSTAGHR